MRRFLTLSLVVLALAVPYATDAAPVFRFLTIDAGGYETDPFGINSFAQIVGVVYDNFYCDDYGCYGSSPHGFLWDSGTATRIDVPGSYETYAFGINDTGKIVGMFSDATGTHGFLKDGNAFTRIDVPGASGTYAAGINNTGQIVGQFWYPASRSQIFLKSGDTFTTIDVLPGASQSTFISVSGINDAGQIVGFIQIGITGTHGFLWDSGTVTTIDVPGASVTCASGINGTGQIVGSFWDPATGYHGFLKDRDALRTIDVPGATHTLATGINDAGQIVGGSMVGSLFESPFQAFLAVPTGNE